MKNQMIDTPSAATDSTQANAADIESLRRKLAAIKALADKVQGRWASLNSDQAPEWTMPYKKILDIIEN